MDFASFLVADDFNQVAEQVFPREKNVNKITLLTPILGSILYSANSGQINVPAALRIRAILSVVIILTHSSCSGVKSFSGFPLSPSSFLILDLNSSYRDSTVVLEVPLR
jgi:hypothetical protein